MNTLTRHLNKVRKIQHLWLDSVGAKPVQPSEFCEKWVPMLRDVAPDERGFRQASVQELAKVTGLDEGTIQNWGKDYQKAPKWIPRMLKMADILNSSALNGHP